MRTKLLLIFSLLVSLVNAQNYFRTCFYNGFWEFQTEMDSSRYYIQIDTTVNDNLWEFGHAEKSLFNTGVSDQVLITDTINPYSINNKSSFEFYIATDCFAYGKTDSYWGTSIYFFYQINSTYGIDGGMMEVKTDDSSWHNIIFEDIFTFYPDQPYSVEDTVSALHAPGLSGDGDLFFSVDIDATWINDGYDSIGFRITFASDSIADNKDGWMFTGISIDPAYESVYNINNSSDMEVFPNPATNNLYLKLSHPDMIPGAITIYNDTGNLVGEFKTVNGFLNISELRTGIYYLICVVDEEYLQKSFIVIK